MVLSVKFLKKLLQAQFESGRNAINWRYLAATNEVLWYSEISNIFICMMLKQEN